MKLLNFLMLHILYFFEDIIKVIVFILANIILVLVVIKFDEFSWSIVINEVLIRVVVCLRVESGIFVKLIALVLNLIA